MQTIIALDVGEKRVGIALLNLNNGVVLPLKTVSRASNQALIEILRLIDEKDISTVVAGMPYGEKGEQTEQCEDVRKFCRRLERRTSVPVVFMDEYSSSNEAAERLKQAGISTRKMKERGLIDPASAALILEDYMHSLKNKRAQERE